MDDYRRLADGVAADIAAGRLRPGDRLPPLRAFARRHGIAGSTAARVYGELNRRGLAVGEVGRGTFVRASAPAAGPALTEPAGAGVDLELNYPVVPGQAGRLAAGLGRLLRPDVLEAALRPVGPAGTPAARAAAAAGLARSGWRPDPARVLFAGNGRQAMAGAVSALVPTGGRLAVEELTYPVIKAIASRLGVTLVPVAMDAHGLRPDALAEAARRRGPLHAVYVQPTLHNPCGTTMPPERRAALAAVLEDLGLTAIEDAVWGFLAEDAPPPLAALAPDRTVLVDGLSKRLSPGLTAGLAAVPPALFDRLSTALRAGSWTPTGYALEAAAGWLADGTVSAIEEAKREDAAARRAIAAAALAGEAPGEGSGEGSGTGTFRAVPRSYFFWWELPAPWRAETFVAAAARRGIAVTPGAAFVAGPGGAPGAVRVGLASPPPDVLARALGVLARIARGGPDDTAIG
ncbi:PLP-dependent aminotransferase family protein [Actinomadura viridis]|uniref:DNA-binding transcriptional MocR family regulator n=1 Tax=Actinomadura viridis TaxID=58110 RepID=A0A931GJN9_9ACTN|nr:PLP-dependent aminotransferase family protein [Actinomadura viridis]MBG6089387.1 DNA-binding transcriptional MocR family regulator [Actinomadura viridis]